LFENSEHTTRPGQNPPELPPDHGKGGAVMTIEVRKVEPVKSTSEPDS
jgi:hypothetical protein